MCHVTLRSRVSSGDVPTARRLFERAVSLKLSSKKTRFFFKKFMSFEQQQGTKETVDAVVERVKAYVKSAGGD